MTDKYDHYKEAEELITMLNAEQLEDYSVALQSAMDKGATGTEIFMALRYNLKLMLNEQFFNTSIRNKAKRLWQELDKALE